jgi:hypothetical protein
LPRIWGFRRTPFTRISSAFTGSCTSRVSSAARRNAASPVGNRLVAHREQRDRRGAIVFKRSRCRGRVLGTTLTARVAIINRVGGFVVATAFSRLAGRRLGVCARARPEHPAARSHCPSAPADRHGAVTDVPTSGVGTGSVECHRVHRREAGSRLTHRGPLHRHGSRSPALDGAWVGRRGAVGRGRSCGR